MAARFRLAMHLSGLVAAALLARLLPFSPLVNFAIAGLFGLIDGATAEFVFNRLATREEKIADLRDRVDNPPS
jgi:hypothetical protein